MANVKSLETVFGAKCWSFKEDVTGRLVEGAKMTHSTGERSSRENRAGAEVQESTIPMELFRRIERELPCCAEVSYDMVQGKKGVELRVADVAIVERVNVEPAFLVERSLAVSGGK